MHKDELKHLHIVSYLIVIKYDITFGPQTMGDVILLPQPLHSFRTRLCIEHSEKKM
jgi:hypothetical protein